MRTDPASSRPSLEKGEKLIHVRRTPSRWTAPFGASVVCLTADAMPSTHAAPRIIKENHARHGYSRPDESIWASLSRILAVLPFWSSLIPMSAPSPELSTGTARIDRR